MTRTHGFTLAEVLITLGIIGIVAAMTMPALIQHHRKQVVETRLKKFYSAINQAVMLAEVEYGDKKIWWEDIPGGEPQLEWFKKYLAPNLKIVEIRPTSNEYFYVDFPDGSSLQSKPGNTRDWYFYPNGSKRCRQYEQNGTKIEGVCRFSFQLCPRCAHSDWSYLYNKGFEPWKYAWNGTIDEAKSKCFTQETQKRYFCTTLIQLHNWKIPKDYPHKIIY